MYLEDNIFEPSENFVYQTSNNGVSSKTRKSLKIELEFV